MTFGCCYFSESFLLLLSQAVDLVYLFVSNLSQKPKRPDLSPVGASYAFRFCLFIIILIIFPVQLLPLQSTRHARHRRRYVYLHARHASYVIATSARVVPGHAYLRSVVVIVIRQLFRNLITRIICCYRSAL